MSRHPLALDARRPAVVVPLTGADAGELLAQVRALPGSGVDVLEWRVDLLAAVDGAGACAGAGAGDAVVSSAIDVLRAVAPEFPELPLLATVRTTREGGGADLDAEAYAQLVGALAESGPVDAVDVEHRHPGAASARAAAERAGVQVVASYHDFDATPPVEEIVGVLAEMEEAGADVAKIAVTPRSAADVVTLLDATERRFRDARRPLVTVAMGALGAPSRLVGGVFGSAATFATAGAASAPGQLPVDDMRSVLDVLARAEGGAADRV